MDKKYVEIKVSFVVRISFLLEKLVNFQSNDALCHLLDATHQFHRKEKLVFPHKKGPEDEKKNCYSSLFLKKALEQICLIFFPCLLSCDLNNLDIFNVPYYLYDIT